jgi:hypothetical protein
VDLTGAPAATATAVAAVTAAVRVARSYGIDVRAPVVLNDFFSVVVHLAPAPVVARIPTAVRRFRADEVGWMTRELALTTHLRALGAPVVGPSARLPPGPHHQDGFTLSFWTHITPDPQRTTTTADCAALLPDLHAALATYPGPLPPLRENTVDLPRWMPLIDRTTWLARADRAVLRAAADRLAPVLADRSGEEVVLHGDAHPGNLLSSAHGLLWIDFEDACRGPREWDYATATATAGAADGSMYAELRSLQVALCRIAARDDIAALQTHDAGLRPFIAHLAR